LLKKLEECPKSSRTLQLELNMDSDLIKNVIKKLVEEEKIIILDDFTYKLIKK